MPAVHVSHLCFSYSGAVTLLDDVDVHLGPGWTGLVGANGAGKTTLLRIIAGQIAPDHGGVTIDPPGARPVMCPQTVAAAGPDVMEFSVASSGAAHRVRGALQLESEQLDRWATLSPGERKRWQVGAALAQEPAVLIVDEPTNHLDGDARRLLLDALRRFDGVGLVVSHDRAFLDALTRATLRFHRSRVTQWRGSYSTAVRAWRAADEAELAEYAALRQEQRKLRRRVADQRRSRTARAARARRTRRRAPTRDHDARSMEKKGRAEAGEREASRRLEVTRSELDRVGRRLADYELGKDKGRSLFFDYRSAPKEWLVNLEQPELTAGPVVVLRDLRLGVRRNDRIRVAGRNGAGKTTLLQALVTAALVPGRHLVYLPQELNPEAAVAALEALRGLPGADRADVLTLVAALGVDPEALLASAAPSPGEARKLAMASGLGLEPWLVVLDEPTNHLDLPSITRLEAALTDYPGALVVVTHDDALAAAVTTTTWLLADGTLAVQSS